MSGWLRLHRKMLDWEWYSCPSTKVVFIHCLLKANWKDSNWRGIEIKRGSFFTSDEAIATACGLSRQVVRTALQRLLATNCLTSESTNRGKVLTVCNFDDYNYDDRSINQPSNQPPNHQATNSPTNGPTNASTNVPTNLEKVRECCESANCENEKDASNQPANQRINQPLNQPLNHRRRMKEERRKSVARVNALPDSPEDFRLIETEPEAPKTPAKKSKPTHLTEPTFDATDSEAFRALLAEWFGYKAERRERYTPIGWRNLLAEFRKYPVADVEKFARRSMASGWKGIIVPDSYELPGKAAGTGSANPSWLPERWHEIAKKVGFSQADGIDDWRDVPNAFKHDFERACRAETKGGRA